MTNYFLSDSKRNIKNLITDLSKALNVDITTLNPLEEKLTKIILTSSTNSLNNILETYFSLLEAEMTTLIARRITPAFQFGIKNDYFTFIGYHGQFSSLPTSKDITYQTFFSFDSISKILTSTITMLLLRDGKVTIDSSINSFNPNFNMDASIKSILKFTAMIQTEKRIDNLPREETIKILKKCRENITEKNRRQNYYQYNDIGYMILRLSIPDFLERLDTILNIIDKDNLTYKNLENKVLITGGKLGLEYITPDTKGRGIPFPGHTGLYGNIEGLLNLYQKITNNSILTPTELSLLLKQPYSDPTVYNLDGTKIISKTGIPLYTAKVGGFYRSPSNITDPNYDKMTSCDFSNLTTSSALASAGTCGSWVMKDDLSYQNKFGTYIGGILTNPYTYINPHEYPITVNLIPNTNLFVNQKGVILGYSAKLNPYKEIIAEYGIILELLTEYLKNTYKEYSLPTQHITYTKQLKKIQ